MSAPCNAFSKPSSLGRYPEIRFSCQFWFSYIIRGFYRDSRDMREICSNAGSVDNIVKREVINERGQLAE